MTQAIQPHSCPACKEHTAAVALWTEEGGPLPVSLCPAGARAHRMARCRTCRLTYAATNEDGRCDQCWGEVERAERPLGPQQA